ncbi:molybdopterin cofactor-binding domain-containing protein [Piscinibacter sakaiensis]|uniref:molybdopterin cofactor-binding domain-containing protein n=1 Tax=Piscinibacter sakaiensis TaxID=1547922 RepID=UPI0037262B9C
MASPAATSCSPTRRCRRGCSASPTSSATTGWRAAPGWPVFTGPWRGLGAGPNVFAIESAIDECARAAGVDAVAFRRANAEDPRLVRVLDRAAEAAGWASTRP